VQQASSKNHIYFRKNNYLPKTVQKALKYKAIKTDCTRTISCRSAVTNSVIALTHHYLLKKALTRAFYQSRCKAAQT